VQPGTIIYPKIVDTGVSCHLQPSPVVVAGDESHSENGQLFVRRDVHLREREPRDAMSDESGSKLARDDEAREGLD
jgi:hypothetical protein